MARSEQQLVDLWDVKERLTDPNACNDCGATKENRAEGVGCLLCLEVETKPNVADTAKSATTQTSSEANPSPQTVDD
jgi:hypothetical protein